MSSSNKGVFSRDELNVLLGGSDGLSEMIARPSSGPMRSKKDVSDMTVAETAALIAADQQQKTVKIAPVSRLYAVPKKEREYHKLLQEEEQPDFLYAKEKPSMASEERFSFQRQEENEEEEPSFPVHRPRGRVGEANAAAHETSHSESSSSSEDDASAAPQRRADSDNDSSEEDRRTARRLRLRQRPKQEAVILERNENDATDNQPGHSSSVKVPWEEERPVQSHPKPINATRSTSASSDEEESTSSEDDSSSGDDSSSVDAPGIAVARPKFVPKHLRDTVPSVEDETTQWDEKEKQRKMQEERRKLESRAMVQQVMVQAKSEAAPSGGANAFYYDLDGTQEAATEDEEKEEEDSFAARDAWEVRELQRIIREHEMEQDRLREKQEQLERRRRPVHDSEMSQKPAAEPERRSKPPPANGPKFFHRGAYYMDDSEWTETDVRHRATEYAQTPVLSDHQHRDRSQLPKVMQVKKFGFANQSKYKGLAAEDTTDRQMKILPIVRPKSKGK